MLKRRQRLTAGSCMITCMIMTWPSANWLGPSLKRFLEGIPLHLDFTIHSNCRSCSPEYRSRSLNQRQVHRNTQWSASRARFAHAGPFGRLLMGPFACPWTVKNSPERELLLPAHPRTVAWGFRLTLGRVGGLPQPMTLEWAHGVQVWTRGEQYSVPPC